MRRRRRQGRWQGYGTGYDQGREETVHATDKAAVKIADTTKDAAEDTAHDTKKVVDKMAHATDKAADKTSAAGKDVGKGTESAAKKTGHGAKKGAEEVGSPMPGSVHRSEERGDSLLCWPPLLRWFLLQPASTPTGIHRGARRSASSSVSPGEIVRFSVSLCPDGRITFVLTLSKPPPALPPTETATRAVPWRAGGR